jgi:hypothetical protein
VLLRPFLNKSGGLKQPAEVDKRIESIEDKLVKLSVSGFRSIVVVATSIAILATDFTVFPSGNRKKKGFGFGLMDLGVGYFILCHSMRLIRNSDAKPEIDNLRKYSLKRYFYHFFSKHDAKFIVKNHIFLERL